MSEPSSRPNATQCAAGGLARPADTPSGWLCSLLIGAVFLGVGLFLWRGVWRGANGSLDFTMIFSAAKLWGQGLNPYDFEAGYAAFVAAGGAGRPKDPQWFAALYPPATYAVLAPLSLGSWGLAKGLWLAISAAAAGLIGLAAGRLVQGWGASRLCVLALVAAWFGFGPVHTTLHMGQLGLIVLALCCPAVMVLAGVGGWTGTKAEVFAAVGLGVAGALKPQLAGPVGLAVVLLGRFRLAAVSLSVFGGLLGLAVLRLSAEEAGAWLQTWRDNLRHFSGAGFADPRPANAHAYQMINVAPLVYRLLPEALAKWVALMPFGLTVVVGAASGWGPRGRVMRRPLPGLLLVSVLSVAGLVSVYHRGYDAVFLVLPVCWAVGILCRARRRNGAVAVAWLVLWGTMIFWVPGPAVIASALHHGQLSGRLPEALAGHPWFTTWVLGHQQWVLLGLWAALFVALLAERFKAEASGPPDIEAAG